MTFDFIYGKNSYTYADGYIYKRYDVESSKELLRVPNKIIEQVEGPDRALAEILLYTLLHGYTYGVTVGKKAKIREFKSMFNIE